MNKLTKEEKIILLKNYLCEDIYVKAIIDTLDDTQLNKFIEQNLDVLLAK